MTTTPPSSPSSAIVLDASVAISVAASTDCPCSANHSLMTMAFHLQPETEQKFESLARKSGKDVEAFFADLVERSVRSALGVEEVKPRRVRCRKPMGKNLVAGAESRLPNMKGPRPMIAEPENVRPERVFEDVVVQVVRELVQEADYDYLLVPKFGLDIALFLRGEEGTFARFLEVKVYAGGRTDAVGFGTPNGNGPQVELLRCAEDNMHLLDTAIRWIMADATREPKTARYALFDCRRARNAAMGGAAPGKQNNLNLVHLKDCLVTWEELIQQIREFLFGPSTVITPPKPSAPDL